VDTWAKGGRLFFNTYGPTEATVVATYARCFPGEGGKEGAEEGAEEGGGGGDQGERKLERKLESKVAGGLDEGDGRDGLDGDSDGGRTGGRVERMKIGRPLANVQCYVLDEHMALVPQGALGELCIGGAGVSSKG
jgi:hypothetical protein